MTAGADFPRGITETIVNPSAAAAITIPASPGIVHVLDSFTARLAVASATTGSYGPVITASSTSLGVLYLGFLNVDLATLGSVDTDGDTNLNIASAPGEALAVAFNAWTAGVTESLRIQWHDL